MVHCLGKHFANTASTGAALSIVPTGNFTMKHISMHYFFIDTFQANQKKPKSFICCINFSKSTGLARYALA